MPNGTDVNSMLAMLIYIVPLIALVISVLTFTNAVKERHGRTAAEAVSLKKDIELLTEKVSDLERQLYEAIGGYHKNDKRITTLETKMTSIEKRVSVLEGHHTKS